MKDENIKLSRNFNIKLDVYKKLVELKRNGDIEDYSSFVNEAIRFYITTLKVEKEVEK